MICFWSRFSLIWSLFETFKQQFMSWEIPIDQRNLIRTKLSLGLNLVFGNTDTSAKLEAYRLICLSPTFWKSQNKIATYAIRHQKFCAKTEAKRF